MQLFPTVRPIYSFHREFRLQLYWTKKKKKIDTTFSDELEATDILYKKDAFNSRWSSYLEIASVDFKMDQKSFWKGLLKHFNGDYLMVDIVHSGLLAQPSGVPILIERGEEDFHLMGASLDRVHLDSVLRKALQLELSAVQQLDATELTIQHVLDYKKSLCRNGFIVFQFYFLKTILDTSFGKYCREHRRPDTNLHPASNPNIPGDGEGGGGSTHIEDELNISFNSIEEIVTLDTDGSEMAVIAKGANSPGDGSEKAVVIADGSEEVVVIADGANSLGDGSEETGNDYDELVKSMREIMAVHTSTLQTIENVISNYRDFMTKAFTKHPTEKYSPRVQMEISKLYTYAQQHAFNQFINVGEEDSKLANYISDMQKRNFAGPSTAKGEKVIKTKEQAGATAKLGEEHAWKYYKEKYKIYRVRWMNDPEESSHPCDICVYDRANLPMIFIEVKTTVVWGKPWFYVTKREYSGKIL
ncbi:uncharacterized protein [Medicago truncatula]|uniref:uncharacterized protein isoform X1 n=1 Tax=Medicago truncatula TaxID=3880 RepID=UPI000D2F20AA|nr:uncharacterized protein LOC25501740 isoform X1 [Medicago truncatula]XP_024629407.1 uncharacterized protein LOC25501740 isoform X1 [Medicago truncatula]XP_024629408.1 uncharacterized protein LOC25501740 isoform X1 [Medicago truncatula]XP_024629409.1 uncharacterized protein LOC25501740 isoform X1 [Medicago truncatula]XP_024629410.1 uncharacterized protein LOC25501740 isoform X1 [Medicago truncatula]